MVWDGWNGLVEIIWIGVIHSDPLLDQTLRMVIQLNWVALTYNINIEYRC
jgi:hypothetical protein